VRRGICCSRIPAGASLVAPFEYTSLVWAFSLSFLVWGDIPKPPVFVGAGLIVIGGLLVIGGEWHRTRSAGHLSSPRAGTARP
jgi:drug/metabolite transporter (DMT)-like permease